MRMEKRLANTMTVIENVNVIIMSVVLPHVQDQDPFHHPPRNMHIILIRIIFLIKHLMNMM